jgi:hypothetical protein
MYSRACAGDVLFVREIRPIVAAETLPIDNDQTVPLRDADPAIPRYLNETYTWAYLNPRSVKLLDRESVVATILWCQHGKLARMALAEIDPGSTVLQTACVYGDFSPVLARHIGAEGSLDYFLMHEVPDDYKRGLVDVVLNNIGPGGRAVFVDYHKPHWANPLKPVMSLVFDTLEPFAKSLWRQDIRDFASEPEEFHWRKESFFGGLYQKVVATPVARRSASQPADRSDIQGLSHAQSHRRSRGRCCRCH